MTLDNSSRIFGTFKRLQAAFPAHGTPIASPGSVHDQNPMRNERDTRATLIDPALHAAGWDGDEEHLIGPGRANVAGGTTYDPDQPLRADDLLRHDGVAVLEAKEEGLDAPPTPTDLPGDADRAPLPLGWWAALDAAPYTDQVSRKTLRSYQRRALEETVARFAEAVKRHLSHPLAS